MNAIVGRNVVDLSSTGHAAPGGFAGWLVEAAHSLSQRLISRRGHSSARQMKLIETLSLGGRRQLMLVVCDGEKFLVGTGAECVQTIVRVADGPRDCGPKETVQCL